LTGKISVVGGRDDLALVANQVVPYEGQKWAALVVGTYYVDKDATFVNVRLVRASDGLVLRTGELVLVNTPVVLRMGKSDPPAVPVAASAPSQPAGPRISGGLYGQLPAPADTLKSGTVRIIQGK
ncbi:MAG: hypothetical protein K2N07_08960, partial [Desulfovibrio sp.]|nr:hypothetical protein [Desulfovibrio sp.]